MASIFIYSQEFSHIYNFFGSLPFSDSFLQTGKFNYEPNNQIIQKALSFKERVIAGLLIHQFLNFGICLK